MQNMRVRRGATSLLPAALEQYKKDAIRDLSRSKLPAHVWQETVGCARIFQLKPGGHYIKPPHFLDPRCIAAERYVYHSMLTPAKLP